MRRTAFVVALAACTPAPTAPGDTSPDAASDTDIPPGVDVTLLPVAARVHRVSVALRQTRAHPDDIAAVEADPAALTALAQSWSRSDAFADQIADLWAEVLHTRSVDLAYPELGPMAQVPARDRTLAAGEEPLRLIREVVAQGRSFSDIFRVDWTLLDRTGAALWAGHDFDPDGPDVQQVRWIDGRPAAGVLSSPGLWARHPSNGANYHRGRAAHVADAFLCEDFASRDVPIDPSIDLADPEAVADAVRTDPACVSCHQAIDPLAAHFWPIFPQPTPAAVFVAYSTGCTMPFLDVCYPVDVWRPEFVVARPALGLRAPSYFGAESSDLRSLGDQLAADPRFARCAVRRLAGWITQTDPRDLPFDDVARWQRRFEDSGEDLREVAVAIATDPAVLGATPADASHADRLAGPLMLRPRALARTVADLTGYRLRAELKDVVCLASGFNCYGAFDALDDPFLGFHVLAGGTDGARALRPVTDPTPMLLLTQKFLAEEAAWAVVQSDLAADDADRRLLGGLADPADPDAARPVLAALHGRILAAPVAPDAPEVDALHALLVTALAANPTPARAWADVIATLLRSPDLLFY